MAEDFFNLVFEVWRTPIFGDNLVELVAKFNKLELAKDFVEYQLSLGNSFVIVKDNLRIEY